MLHFREQYHHRIWGGRRLATRHGKPLPPDQPIGEAWLVSDHPGDESVVDEGPAAGRTLHDLMRAAPDRLLGRIAAPTPHGRFPLLLKVLDSVEHLSVQVHPDDDCARRLGEPDVGKTEMWHVLDAEPGSELICGIRQDATRDGLAAAVAATTLEDLLVRFEVSPGDSAFIPAGTIHAIGGGILLAEIQQNSDLTYRLYDWGRLQPDGTPRALHLDKALEAIHFGSPHCGRANPLDCEREGGRAAILAACRYFAAELVVCAGRYARDTRGDSFHIVLAASGELSVICDSHARALAPGEAVLVPGSVEAFDVEGEGRFLEYYVPDLARDIVEPLLLAGHAREDIARLGGAPGHSDLDP